MATDFDDFATESETDDTPALKPGDLRSGESMTVTIEGQPETFDSDQYGEGFRMPVSLEVSDAEHTTEDGGVIGPDEPATLVSWSRRLAAAVKAYADTHEEFVGAEVEIAKDGSGMDTQYNVYEA